MTYHLARLAKPSSVESCRTRTEEHRLLPVLHEELIATHVIKEVTSLFDYLSYNHIDVSLLDLFKMDNVLDVNKRFKAEPEELIIEETFFEGSSEGDITNNSDNFQYQCTRNTSAFAPPLFKDAVPAILDGQFFEVLTVSETTCTALCKLCEPCRKTINGSLKATGNFYDHIKRMHTSYMAEAETKRGAKRRPRSKKFNPEKTAKTEYFPVPGAVPVFLSPPGSCSQNDAFNAIFEFACETMRPTSVVESESFRNMVEVLSGSNSVRIGIPTSQEIEVCIQRRLSKMAVFIGGHLKQRDFVCATVDLWKQSEDHGFVGVCGHTLDPSTFERESFALGFRPVKLDSNFDIAKEIAAVLSKHNIEKKVRSLVTHNVNQHSGLINEEYNPDGRFRLEVPNQLRSFTHILNLVVTEDVTGKSALRKHFPDDVDGEKSKVFAKVYDSTMNKLFTFWRFLKNSPRAADFFAQFCGKIPRIPTDEWPSKFEAIKIINETENIHNFLNHVTLPRGKRFLEKEDLDFLAEYVIVMQPFATAFDVLKDAGSLAGTVLPTILSVRCRLDAMAGLLHGEPLRTLALRGLNERFELFDLEKSSRNTSILIATISHPAFKMCLPYEFHAKAREAFLGVCSTMSQKYAPVISGESPKNDSFFSVLKSTAPPIDCVSNEGMRYLTDDSEDLSMLERYPWVKSIFLEYNTCLSSSAAVERLLSIGSSMLCANFGVGDKHFESCLLLKVNKHLN